MTIPIPSLDAPPTDDRFLRSLWRLVRWALPEYIRFHGLYEYRIAKAYPATGTTVAVDLQATDDTVALGLADIPKVTPWAGLAGSAPSVTPGARVLVAFINGSPARPFVVAWAPFGDAGWLPAAMRIDVAAGGVVTIGDPNGSPKKAARDGDAAPAGGLTGTTAAGPVTFTYVDAFGNVTTGPAVLLVGKVNASSTKLEAE